MSMLRIPTHGSPFSVAISFSVFFGVFGSFGASTLIGFFFLNISNIPIFYSFDHHYQCFVSMIPTLFDYWFTRDALPDPDTLAIVGALSQAQDVQSLIAAGTIQVTGALVKTAADDTVVSAGALGIAGALTQTQAAQSVSGVGAVAITGALTQTQAAQLLSSVGGAPATVCDLSATQADQTLAASGAVAIVGALAQAQWADTLAASGALAIVGSLTQTQAAQTLSAAGSVTTPVVDWNQIIFWDNGVPLEIYHQAVQLQAWKHV
jgi:hypothetical protein